MALYYRLLFPNQAFRQLEDIEQLVPFMYLSNTSNSVATDDTSIIPNNKAIEHLVDLITVKELLPPIPPSLSQTTSNPIKQQMASIIYYPKQPDSLFWCIYIARYGYQAYTEIGHRYGNTEIEEKQRIMEMMRASPNKIKDCPKRITKAQYQEIMSDFMTDRKITTAMLIVFVIYCNLRIWVVNMGKLGSPDSWYMDIYGNDGLDLEPIVIYCKNRNQYGIAQAEGEQLRELVSNIKSSLFRFDNYDAPLKAISNYKTMDLEDIADYIGIKFEGKIKKQDIYDKIIQKLNNAST